MLQSEVEQGYITQAEADAANNEPLPTWLPQDQLRPSSLLVSEVQDRLLNDPRLGNTPKKRRDTLLKGGLTITTTFDKNLQSLADDAVRNALPRSPAGADWGSSLVAIDPATGAVKAMSQTSDFADSQYNIGTHPVGRQPGSTWKVIALAAALANGYSANDSINGSAPCSVPSKFGNATTINSEGHGGGSESLWAATAGSVNCAFVRLSTSVGQDKVMDMAHKMGITQQRLFPHLTLAIGDIEATPLEMATVMATIANDGVHQSPYFVQKVMAPNNPAPVIDETNRAGLGDRVLDQDVAECAQLMLRGVITGGTGTGYTEVPGHEPFGKTGTTDNKSDAWFLGGTPQMSTAVWFGNRATNQLSAGFGGPTAGPIWKRFMVGALEGAPNIPLPDRGSNGPCNRPGRADQPGRRARRTGAGLPAAATAAGHGDAPRATLYRDPAPTDHARGHAARHHSDHASRAMTTAAGLESLLMLQEHDGALDRLLHRRETLPERDTVASGEASLGVLAAQIGVLTGERDEIAHEEKRLDDEASTLREKAAEVEAKMYSGSVSSPRELQAMQADIEQLRRLQRNLENRELELMEAREPLDANLVELDTRRTALWDEVERARSALEAAEVAIDQEMAEERKAREAIAGELEPALVGDYERRRARARGVGVARLVGMTCQGCHLSIPSTEVDSIRRAPEGSISYCDNCGCILVP